MATGDRHRGTLTYTHRAALQDAQQAMGNDLINALIELVTNADDSYERMGVKGLNDIRIGVDRGTRTITVEDDGEGMSRDDLESRLTTIGGSTSEFGVHAGVRGFFGRGAKDVPIFGATTWSSIRGGERATLTIRLHDRSEAAWESQDRGSSSEEEHGTEVTIHLRSDVSIPRHSNLLERLGRHFALRPILLDRHRNVTLSDGSLTQRVVFEQPRGRKNLGDSEVELEGFNGITAIVRLFELEDSAADTLSREYYRYSFLVRSGRAAYEIWPGGRFARHPHATFLQRLYGEVEIPALNNLMRERDQAGLPPIVTRGRRGLERGSNHEFAAALDDAIESVIAPQIERMQREARLSTVDATSPESRKMLDQLAAELAKYVKEQTDDEFTGSGRTEPHVPLGLSFIPPVVIVAPEQEARLVVRYKPPMMGSSEITANVSQQDDGGVRKTGLVPLKARYDYYSRTIRIPGRADGSLTQLDAELEDLSADAAIRWRDRPGPVVDEVRFDNTRYGVRQGGRRNAKLLAPFSALNGNLDQKPKVSLDTRGIAFELGQEFIESPDGQYAIFEIALLGNERGAEGTLTAALGPHSAAVPVSVTSGGLAGLKIIYEDGVEGEPNRAWYEADQNLLKINALHPDVKNFLGPKEEMWPGQSTPEFRTLLRELVCHTMVSYAVSRTADSTLEPAEVLGRYEIEVQGLIRRTRSLLVADI